MPSLTVLFMGRRKKITIGANTPLSEALAQARTVFNVNQKLSYELRRRNQKTAVDLTCPFRLSGISNNAQLELVVTSSKSTGAGGGGACECEHSFVPRMTRGCTVAISWSRNQGHVTSPPSTCDLLANLHENGHVAPLHNPSRMFGGFAGPSPVPWTNEA
mgnify:CR=1 FL=1